MCVCDRERETDRDSGQMRSVTPIGYIIISDANFAGRKGREGGVPDTSCD